MNENSSQRQPKLPGMLLRCTFAQANMAGVSEIDESVRRSARHPRAALRSAALRQSESTRRLKVLFMKAAWNFPWIDFGPGFGTSRKFVSPGVNAPPPEDDGGYDSRPGRAASGGLAAAHYRSER